MGYGWEVRLENRGHHEGRGFGMFQMPHSVYSEWLMSLWPDRMTVCPQW